MNTTNGNRYSSVAELAALIRETVVLVSKYEGQPTTAI